MCELPGKVCELHTSHAPVKRRANGTCPRAGCLSFGSFLAPGGPPRWCSCSRYITPWQNGRTPFQKGPTRASAHRPGRMAEHPLAAKQDPRALRCIAPWLSSTVSPSRRVRAALPSSAHRPGRIATQSLLALACAARALAHLGSSLARGGHCTDCHLSALRASGLVPSRSRAHLGRSKMAETLHTRANQDPTHTRSAPRARWCSASSHYTRAATGCAPTPLAVAFRHRN